MNISKVFCFLHGKEFIGLDTHIFKLICKKCIDMNVENREVYLCTNKEKPKQEVSIIHKCPDDDACNCAIHLNEKATFYCDDCNDFICKTCFASDHRTHNSTTNKLSAETIRKTIKKILESLQSMHLDEPLKALIEIWKRIKDLRFQASNKNSKIKEKILDFLAGKMINTLEYMNEINEGVDIDLKNLNERILCLINNINKYSKSISERIRVFNMTDSNCYKCKCHKDFQQELITINKSIDEMDHYIKDKLKNKLEKIEKKMPLISNSLHKFIKNLQSIEFSIISSIKSGITPKSIRLRRYIRFSSMCRYYKTSSLELSVNKPVTLVGLGLCGLLEQNIEKRKTGLSNLDDKENININIPSTNELSYINIQKVTESIFIPITISIKEKRQGNSDYEMLEFSAKMHSLINSFDPIFVFYFPKTVNLRSETTYLITVTNNDRNHMYLHIFGGSVPKVYQDKLEQNIVCNNSGIHFNFSAVNDIESDFNEFNFGLITDLLYCYVE